MMRKILFRGKRTFCNEWVYGDLGHFPDRTKIDTHENGQPWRGYDVFPETVGQFTGVYDTELTKIFEGDIVRFLRYVGKIVFEEGCFGIAISCNDAFDWDYIDEEMKEYAGTNQITACFNDHFISLWEILWNFDCDQNICNVVEVIGNIHDNPELLEGGVE